MTWFGVMSPIGFFSCFFRLHETYDHSISFFFASLTKIFLVKFYFTAQNFFLVYFIQAMLTFTRRPKFFLIILLRKRLSVHIFLLDFLHGFFGNVSIA